MTPESDEVTQAPAAEADAGPNTMKAEGQTQANIAELAASENETASDTAGLAIAISALQAQVRDLQNGMAAHDKRIKHVERHWK